MVLARGIAPACQSPEATADGGQAVVACPAKRSDGTWLSPVERLVRDEEVGSSNLPVPTIDIFKGILYDYIKSPEGRNPAKIFSKRKT